MHVITRKRLNEFAKLYPDTTIALTQWYQIVKHSAICLICRTA
jgi:mRNA interferase HigB